jgi:CheY-like chemotaxis protein
LAKILIVDDDSAVQLTMLERAGHSLVAASDGRKGRRRPSAGRVAGNVASGP